MMFPRIALSTLVACAMIMSASARPGQLSACKEACPTCFDDETTPPEGRRECIQACDTEGEFCTPPNRGGGGGGGNRGNSECKEALQAQCSQCFDEANPLTRAERMACIGDCDTADVTACPFLSEV